MKKGMLYYSIKMAIAVALSIGIAEAIGLNYATTSGIITMLSVLNNRKQTYKIGFKRMVVALVAIFLAMAVFYLASHTLMAMAVFLLVYTFLLAATDSLEGLTVGTVLVTHIYSLHETSISVMTNEIGVMMVGIIMAWVVTIHMPNRVGELTEVLEQTEKEMRYVLYKMSLLLLNQCAVDEPKNHLKQLDAYLSKGQELAINYSGDYLRQDKNYYIYYFEMRRQQYLLLKQMERHFEVIFITVEHAQPLSDFTAKIADEFHESNTAKQLLDEAKKLLDFYREKPLPTCREEFEHRAILYEYLNDLIRLIEIKLRFIESTGALKTSRVSGEVI